MKSKKQALLTSGLCLGLSAALLVGTTFAWFTDSVTNEGNVITSGNLSIDAYAYKLGTGSQSYTIDGINNNQEFTFVDEGVNLEGEGCGPIIEETNWEPGISNAKLLTVTNTGDLATNIRLSFDLEDGGLMDALWFDFIQVGESGATGTFTPREMSTINALAQSTVVKLEANKSVSFILVYGMDKEAGNTYQGKSFSADVTVMATQATSETDGFGNPNYDAAADGSPDYEGDWTVGGTAILDRPASGWAAQNVLAVSNAKAVVPLAAIADDAPALKLTIVEQDVAMEVEDYQAARSFDINLEGLNAGNHEVVMVTLNLEKGLNGVQVYHKDALMGDGEFAYDAATGVLTIQTTSFSPFTVVYNKTVVETVEELNAVLAVGGTVTLGGNIDAYDQVCVPEGVTAVLDLNGYTINSTYDGYAVENKGTLTINDSKGTGIVCHTGTAIASNYGHDAIRNFGTLTINGGTFGDSDMDRTNANPDNRGAGLRNQSGATCTINGGYFTCGDNYWPWGTGTGFSYAIRNMGTMTINDATLYGAMNGGIASEEFGKLTIHGGSFSVTGPKSYYVLVTGGLGEITITGGTFTKTGGNGGLLGGFSGMPSWDASEALEENGYYITGGTFVQDGNTVTFES